MGLIYADRAAAGDIVVAERELSLLRTLRNQAIMAFKHAARPG
jgi:eukaryotic-like serine/threonine-protein kinase